MIRSADRAAELILAVEAAGRSGEGIRGEGGEAGRVELQVFERVAMELRWFRTSWSRKRCRRPRSENSASKFWSDCLTSEIESMVGLMTMIPRIGSWFVVPSSS